jgi:signal transduction histidine kinase
MSNDATVIAHGNPHILVVDDNHANLHLMADILGRYDYVVRPVPSGELAISSAQEYPPDLILLDIMMPGLSGYDVCERLKADERTRDIPVIFISVNDDLEGKIRAFSSGAVDYITKPFQTEEVVARVKTHLTLRALQQSLEQKNADLKQEIAERQQIEADLQDTLTTLQKTQRQLIESEKMAMLGQLVAGITHELNTPLAAIRSSTDSLTTTLKQSFDHLAELFELLPSERQQDFFALLHHSQKESFISYARKKRKFRRTLRTTLHQHQIPDADDVAHVLLELGIYEDIAPVLPLLSLPNSLQILTIARQLRSVRENAHTLAVAVDQAFKVVKSMKMYARYDHSDTLVQADITKGLDAVLILHHNKLKQGIDVHRHYEDVPLLPCYPDELNQVWMNLIQNALHAMNNRGELTIVIRRQDGHVVVSITDTGPGIPDDIKTKIFTPFFTTKPSGKGTGLGLDIVNKIIEKHRGRIDVDSSPGKTTFSVWLPLTQEHTG